MPTSPDCLVCLVRQSLEAARCASNDIAIHNQVVRNVMALILENDVHIPPPLIGQKIHRIIRETTQNPDPYIEGKRATNAAVLKMYDRLERQVAEAADPLEMAVRLAIAGNTIDYALGKPNQQQIDAAFEDARTRPINGDFSRFHRLIDQASTILYLCDNAGEIICDRLLIELLVRSPYSKKITLAVRGKPVLNDALREDAAAAGLDRLVPVIDNGNDGLGTMLDQCTDEFLDKFQNSDLVLSKGLANYETLVENTTVWQPRRIVYLFKAKCPFISHFSGTALGDLVVRVQ
ncbi:MAG: ARMT1-like domain-containing protein [Planctomycetia bacterium]|nr:ARMT1-like domain-containing protein [Planctomycetia bacterium]